MDFVGAGIVAGVFGLAVAIMNLSNSINKKKESNKQLEIIKSSVTRAYNDLGYEVVFEGNRMLVGKSYNNEFQPEFDSKKIPSSQFRGYMYGVAHQMAITGIMLERGE